MIHLYQFGDKLITKDYYFFWTPEISTALGHHHRLSEISIPE